MPDPIQFTASAQAAARRREREQREQRKRRRRRQRTAAVAAIIAVIAVVVVVVTAGSGTSPQLVTSIRPTADTVDACPDLSQSGALHVSGNKVLDAAGKTFVFYGVTVYGGLEDGGDNQTWLAGEKSAEAQIKAARYWHANTVRLQVNEENLFNDGNPRDGLNERFLGGICRQVQLIRSEGMEAVINDQTEWPEWDEANPTARTVAFWKVMGTVFGNQPGVIFDLFNEPRLFYPKPATSYKVKPAIDPDWVWKMWQQGGEADGQKFVGMQQLIDDVRNQTVNGAKVNNLIWVEGPYDDNALASAGDYPVHGTNLVWSIHHPLLTGRTAWDQLFGYLAKTYPVVDGEWGQYASNRPECRADAYAMVPAYFKYLRAHDIGLIAWSLQPGSMLAGVAMPDNTSNPDASIDPRELRKPSTMKSDYACTNSKLGEGTGRLLYRYFNKYSRPAS